MHIVVDQCRLVGDEVCMEVVFDCPEDIAVPHRHIVDFRMVVDSGMHADLRKVLVGPRKVLVDPPDKGRNSFLRGNSTPYTR
jgi:hypothetical protein